MIFAPRSCPSSPGLATTTRILPLDAASTADGDATCGCEEDSWQLAVGSWRGSSGRPGPSARCARCPALGGRGVHVARFVGALRWDVLGPARSVREHAAALLPAGRAASGSRRGLA